MSFETSPIRQPLIQNPHTVKNNGGGGNLGYMQQEKKKKDEEEKNLLSEDDSDILEFNSDDDVSAELDLDEKNETPSKNWFKNIAEKIGEKISEKTSPHSNNPFTNTTF